MQALYDNGRTTLVNPVAQVAEDLSINLFRRTLDELSRVWEALQEPYRLSVCYQVRITRVDSTLTTFVSDAFPWPNPTNRSRRDQARSR
jgi:hypothetical protein